MTASMLARASALLVFVTLPLACSVEGSPGDGTGSTSGTGGQSSTGGGGTGAVSGSGGSGSGGSVDRSCSEGSDCALVSVTCCGTCGAPTASDMTSVRKGSEAAHTASVCGDNTACPACATQSEPNLYATCEAGTCEARDLREETASACSTDMDCVVKPAACCECGAGTEPWSIVALATTDTTFLASLCDATTVCADCAWVVPDQVSAVCAEGHCKVVDARQP